MAEIPPGLINIGNEPLKQFKARYNFAGAKGKEDELLFSKGDLITVTLQVPGGWWEGMIGERSGWFPCNYVKEIKSKDAPAETKVVNDTQGTEHTDKLKYHTEVIESLLETERQLTSELQTLISTYLKPLESANILSVQDRLTLCCNLEEILGFQQDLIRSIEEAAKLEGKQRRIGACFMRVSTQYRTLYSAYSANHPKAVAVLTEHSESLNNFMESRGSPSPGLMFLTTKLSSPFRKMENYTVILKELERHLPAGHPDKIDTSTCISVYKEIATYCQMLRKRKEIELDITTHSIQGWEGEEISSLGDIIEMTQGAVMVDGAKCERFYLVFHQCLVVLSPTSSMSAFTFQGKYSIESVSLARLPDTEKEQGAFELSAPGLSKVKITCQSVLEREQLIDAVEMAPSKIPVSKVVTVPPGPSQKVLHKPGAPTSLPESNHILNSPILQGAIDLTSPNLLGSRELTSPSFLGGRDLSSPTPVAGPTPPAIRYGNIITCLRPAPPVNPMTIWSRKDGSSKSPKGRRRMLATSKKKDKDKGKTEKGVESAIIQKLDSQVQEEDNRILKVIEAYCFSAGSRNASNSVPLEAAPHVFLAEDEKIIVEETKGTETVMEEKTLVDTVYALRDQVKDLMNETKQLRGDLADERKARRQLETSVRHSIARYDRYDDKFEESNL